MGVHVSHPETPSSLPPQPTPQGFPSEVALSAPFHSSNLDWSSISHMVIYMSQCYSLKSSHPRPLPQSPKDCVSFAVSHLLGHSYHLSKFHIYALVYYIGVFLSDLLHSI